MFNVKSVLMNYVVELNKGKEHISTSSKHENDHPVRDKYVEKPRIKLPEIQLPKFDGSLDKWISFRDIFKAMIIDTESIPKVQKFVYLNGCLLGEAKKLVDKISLSETGFDLAWQALKDRYDQLKLIIFKHISELFSRKIVQKDSLQDLRSLIDDCRLHYRALQNLSQPVESWNMVIVYFVIQRLDDETRKLWETESNNVEELTFEDLMEFLNGRCNVLQSISDAPSNHPSSSSSSMNSFSKNRASKFSSRSKTFLSSKSESPRCQLCSENHIINNCKQFLSLSPKDRYEKVKCFGLCLKCLVGGHSSSKCYRPGCKICRSNHNELLHFPSRIENASKSNASENENCDSIMPPKINDTLVSMACKNDSSITAKHVILPTAVILIADHDGKFHECRALLDSASQSNLMSKKLASKLKLESQNTTSTVFGLNNMAVSIRKKVNPTIRSRVKEYGKKLQFLVVPEISSCLPNEPFDISQWNLPHSQLADNSFNISSEVDVILGAEIFFDSLHPDKKSSLNFPTIFQETQFGFVAAGIIDQSVSSQCFFLSNVITDEENLNRQVQSFWDLESCSDKRTFTVDEKKCEEIFEKTVSRCQNGRFVVTLPFRDTFRQLGNSRSQALKRLNYLENRLSKNAELREQYCAFMKEYESLGHMALCEVSHPFNEEFFLPHHAVIRPDSTTTKLRVVFDASASSSTGLSLNDVLLVGPQLQDELFDLVLRFRRFAVVFTADIEKMYRQILVVDDHAQYQKILWRENPSCTIREYELKTVTYGTSSAPYLATKVLQHLSKIVEKDFPHASRTIANDFYMDDLLSGCNTIAEAQETIRQIIVALESAGMKIRKWSSNHPSVLSAISDEDKTITCSSSSKVIKTLGLRWDPESDAFSFEVKKMDEIQTITKRTVLADVAKLFDPLGQLGPVIITAKLFIQTLWIQKLDWDEELTIDLKEKWIEFRSNLVELNKIVFPRCLFSVVLPLKTVELHGFADASQYAYGACLYVRSEDESGEIHTNLVCSKSRVAPLKTTTIPRLELNAAHLLSKLANRVKNIMPDLFQRVVLWTDSSIVIAWLKIKPQHLKLYVANRIAEIQELTPNYEWKHVNSKANPADVLSRGVAPSDVEACILWWKGPPFLKLSESHWPQKFVDNMTSELPEVKDTTFSFKVLLRKDVIGIENFSSFVRLTRVTAYVLRYVRNLRFYAAERKRAGVVIRGTVYGCLTSIEIVSAITTLVKIVQYLLFRTEFHLLQKSKPLPKNSKLLSLSPFIHEDMLIRVGGRLQNSSLPFDQMHPILLPKHHLSSLIIEHHHKQNLHAGVQSTLSAVRQKYWPLDGVNSVKKIIRQCLACFKVHPRRSEQIMGSLPASRTEICRPFNTTGLDFCGPFYTRYKSQRKDANNKTYVCIFICFVTKAIHLETIEDLPTNAFLDGLKRFMARRGVVSTIWSDNGTNFVGAKNEIDRLQKMFFEDNKLIDFITTKGIEWKFIPPRSPHFGGLWESAVRMFKLHFNKIIGTTVLPIEVFMSLVIQIEGVLNSRPLTTLSSDPHDLQSLTPGHFLTGGPINTIIEPDLTTVPANRVKYWEKSRQMLQFFWKRFSLEYIHTLQQKQKWQNETENIKCDDIVLIVDDNTPSFNWLLGRIVEVVPAKDGKVRVAVARTKNGLFKRAITKFAKIPMI